MCLVVLGGLQIVAGIKAQTVHIVQRAADRDARHIFHRRNAFGDKARFADGICRIAGAAAHLTIVILVDPRQLGERRQVAKRGIERMGETRTDVAGNGLGVRGANVQRHAVTAVFTVAIHVLVAVRQPGKRCQHNVGWQGKRIAKLALQRNRLTVIFALRTAFEAGEVHLAVGLIVLTVYACGQVHVPRLAAEAGVTNNTVVVGGRVVTVQVVLTVHGGVAVVHRRAHAPQIAQRAIRTDDETTELRAIAADVLRAVLVCEAAERLTPEDPVFVSITGCYAACAANLRVALCVHMVTYHTGGRRGRHAGCGAGADALARRETLAHAVGFVTVVDSQ